MSGKDRQPYLTAATLDQGLLNYCQDNLNCRLEMIADIETPDGFIYASDRNKYMGTRFYEALCTFPVIERTIGDWLVGELEFSTLTLQLSNADGRFDKYLPGGNTFESWIGKTVEVSLGLAENASTYFKIFSGTITDIGGFTRDTYSITLIARDKFDALNIDFPNSQAYPTWTFNIVDYPYISSDLLDTNIPFIIGDWTTATTKDVASVPAFVTNGDHPALVKDRDRQCAISIASPCVITLTNHKFINDLGIVFLTTGTLPTGITPETVVYYVKNVTTNTFEISLSPGGSSVNTSGTQTGQHSVKVASDAINTQLADVRCKICVNDIQTFDTTEVYLKRGDAYYRMNSADIYNINAAKNEFSIKQFNALTTIPLEDGTPALWYVQEGDIFFVKVDETVLGYSKNAVDIAQRILDEYTVLDLSTVIDFTTWDYFRNKTIIQNTYLRVWQRDTVKVLDFVLSILEQVSLEMFIGKNLKLKLSSTHFDEFEAAPSYAITNFDIIKDSMRLKLDNFLNINRLSAVFNFLPDVGENAYSTKFYRNGASIIQVGKEISKQIIMPNMYIGSQVEYFLQETLKLTSAYFEVLEVELTWRNILLDIGDFVKLNIEIGSVTLQGVPGLVRKIGYNPEGVKVVAEIWCLQMVPFPGWTPGYAGIVGGYNATITSE